MERDKFIRTFVALVLALSLASCAPAETRKASAKEQLSVRQIVSTDMQEIDLNKWEMVCEGRKSEVLDRVEGVLVKGISCEEPEHMAFVYIFNEEPFFLAIMSLNEARTKLTPAKGFGAFENKRKLLPVSLDAMPVLPRWAMDKNGAPLKSIYKETPDNPAID